MSILHMQTEEAEAVRRELAQLADLVAQEEWRINGRVQLLEGVWLGSSSRTFVYEADYRLAELRRLAQEASVLAQRLQREVEKWETVDLAAG